MRNVVTAPGTSSREISEIAEMLQPYAPVEGINPSPVEGVGVFRADQVTRKEPVIYDPCLIVVAQGSKRGYLGNHSFDYNPSSYLACSVPVPVEAEILEASPDRPFLALGFPILASEIGELQLEIDDTEPLTEEFPRPINASPLQGEILDAVVRLIRTFENQADAKVLGPLIKREILFRVLRSEQGGAMRAVVQRQGHFRRIGEVMRAINEDCARPVTTTDMMQMAGMSKTTLHESFKAVTAMTPLQFVKSIRLHKARALMLNEGLAASTAAYQVGYVSASQFSREFKRQFGLPPSEIGKFG